MTGCYCSILTQACKMAWALRRRVYATAQSEQPRQSQTLIKNWREQYERPQRVQMKDLTDEQPGYKPGPPAVRPLIGHLKQAEALCLQPANLPAPLLSHGHNLSAISGPTHIRALTLGDRTRQTIVVHYVNLSLIALERSQE